VGGVNPDLLTVRSAPPAPAPAPWCAAYVDYDDGPVVAVLWWDDRPFSARGARLGDEAGVLAEGLLDRNDDLPEPGWQWWLVGSEIPWHHDPRFAVAEVEAVGPGTPSVAVEALIEVLAEAPEPTFSREQSIEMIAHRLPWFPAEDDMAAVFKDAGESIGTGTVVIDEGDDP
jgi:hypothetical protein